MKKEDLTKFLDSTGKIFDLMSPNEANVQSILDWIMPDLDPAELRRSLISYYKYLETQDQKYVNYFNPIPGLFAKYGAIQKHQRVARKVGLTWWPYIKKYVANPEYVLDMVGRKKPEIKRMLSTPLGAAYIEYYTNELYSFFDLWFHKFPRFHNDCGGLILYGVINKEVNAWGFFCRRCKQPISLSNIDEITHNKRINKVK